jgi:hypothetical protein
LLDSVLSMTNSVVNESSYRVLRCVEGLAQCIDSSGFPVKRFLTTWTQNASSLGSCCCSHAWATVVERSTPVSENFEEEGLRVSLKFLCWCIFQASSLARICDGSCPVALYFIPYPDLIVQFCQLAL